MGGKLTIPTGRRVAAFGYMAGFAGSAVAIDVWCHQKSGSTEKYGALLPYPNEDALISYTKERLATAGRLIIGWFDQRN
jgi:saccharopine dehydrogenase (NAD+, L-lysine-forming)